MDLIDRECILFPQPFGAAIQTRLTGILIRIRKNVIIDQNKLT